ncbi:uncharacterized protein LOC119648202 isoform X3 [Hermetia illucens]|uniref:uncharacterized protein LOC119648202 isoform X3 n=1 Tax=Hermetia illucens TaxID=343691 RepID=UPI0018CC6608|nr:uncharacterized protein LOC119648202 isoform X3 [Hermetia illucens]XP_037905730.1 uncharacterized protein LOC119648202 isoform X3 [Hermetia illucens]XP_037905731.1 uncharacterized protein LOC119648202 isoform X3 [Hermetia illucens]
MNVRKLFLSTSLRNITSTMRGALEFRRLDWQRNICTGHPIFIPLTERTLIQRGCFNWERLYCTSGQTLVAVYSEIKDLPKHPEKLLIDVREPREIDEYGKIPGSINIPLGALEDTLSSKLENRSFTRKFNRKFPDPTDELIFSCQKGVRAQKASEIATRLGYKNRLKGPRSVTSQLDPRNFSIPANILSYVAAQITPQKLCRNFLGCSERRFSEEVVRHRPPESSFFGIRFKLEEIPQNTQRAQGTNPAQCKSVSFCGL